MSDLTDMVLAEVPAPPITAQQIAQKLGIELHTVTAALRGLERAGLVDSDDYLRSEPVFTRKSTS